MIKVKVFAVNPFREATYVVYDETGEAVVIDCGLSSVQECERFDKFIADNKLTLRKAVNTHCHVDHITGVGYVTDRYEIPFAASAEDAMFVEQFEPTAAMYQIEVPSPAITEIDVPIRDGDYIRFGNSKLNVIATPGHTKGGLVFYNEDQKILFTGDSLFKDSIGRTDLPGGSYEELMESIMTKIMPLGGDVKVYPGHGDSTTLAQEAMYNPFITDVMNGEVKYK